MDLTPFIFLEELLLHPSHKNQGGGRVFWCAFNECASNNAHIIGERIWQMFWKNIKRLIYLY